MLAARPLADDVSTAPGERGGVPVLGIETGAASHDAVVLWLHGGWYAIGSPRTSAELSSDLARRIDAKVISVDYRLAPEDPYPAALQDARAAYSGLLDSRADPRSIAIVGESAGGGFGGRAARVAGRGWVGSAGCHCPDFTVDRPNPQRQDDDVVGRHRRGVHPGEGERSSGRLLRLRRSRGSLDQPDLRRLPRCVADPDPGWITRDPVDDSIRLARRAASDDVAVTLDVTPGVPHGFQAFAAMLEEGDAALARAAHS